MADSGIIADGKFRFLVTPGTKRVEITASSSDQEWLQGIMPAKPAGMDLPDISIPLEYIPDRYNENSTLSSDVTVAGPNEFNFELERD